MESTAFFEKKLNLTPNELNEVKHSSIESLLEKKAKYEFENKCSENGFVLPGSIKLISRSMGYFESARFTGDVIYYVKLEGKIIYPADGVRIIGEVIRKNKMGLYVDFRKAIRIQVPRDLHIGSEEYEEVEIGDTVEVELKRSKFQIKDPYIIASGIFITKKLNSKPSQLVESTNIQEEEQDKGVEGQEQEEEGEGEEQEAEGEEEGEEQEEEEQDEEEGEDEGEDEEEEEEEESKENNQE